MALIRLGWIVAASMAGSESLGHEFWIDPIAYEVAPGAPIVGNLKNGQNFVGGDLTYFDRRFTRFDLLQDQLVLPVPGRMGDIPALNATAPNDGLWTVAHQTTQRRLTYRDWEKFAAFAAHKDFPNISERHAERNLPPTGFSEVYTRFAKALVGVGDAAGQDVATGMETEFIAMANPYTDQMEGGFPVRLTYQGQPRADAQIEIFQRAPDGEVVVTTLRTDDAGAAVIPVRAGHIYLLDAVVLRPASPDSGAAWETLWAAMTFAVPAR